MAEQFRRLPMGMGTGRGPIARQNALYQARQRVQLNEDANEASTRERFIDAAEHAALHNPTINQQVFRDIIAAYDEEAPQFRGEMEAARREAPDRRYFESAAANARRGLMERVRGRIAPHGATGSAAMAAIYSEMQPESVFTPVVRQIYNTDKGGLQVAGTLGALALGGLGYYLTQGSGWLISGAVTVLGGVLGAFVANKAFGGPDTPSNLPNFRVPAQNGPAVSPTVGTGMPTVAVSSQIQPAPLTGNESRQFTAPATPVVVENGTGIPSGSRFTV